MYFHQTVSGSDTNVCESELNVHSDNSDSDSEEEDSDQVNSYNEVKYE